MKRTLIVLVVLTALALAACAPRTTTTILSPEEGTAYAAEVDEIVENMIVGFTENDFAKITRDMPDDLDKNYEASIRQFANETIGEWGAYQGKTLDRVEARGGWRVVIYHLVFENEPNVTLEVIFESPASRVVIGTNWTTE
jgi:hypothetical protein